MAIEYRRGEDVTLDEVVDLYVASTIRRPTDERERMRRMLRHADLVITAHDGDELVGIARSLTDFAYATYLSDLAVRSSHQRQGIGIELIRRTAAATPEATVHLLAAEAAVPFYERHGLVR